jgi:Cys-tRNA(Pro)/Cys-tRNA(Cys) deacylase
MASGQETAHKTNAMRLLESLSIPYSALRYDASDPDSDASDVAEQVGLPPSEVFKTLVVRGDKNGINVFCVPADASLDLKKAASASGNKKTELVAVKELFALTGYIRGGCSPLCMKKHYPTFFDETMILFDAVCVSAGVRGLQIRVNPHDLLSAAGAVFADII